MACFLLGRLVSIFATKVFTVSVVRALAGRWLHPDRLFVAEAEVRLSDATS